MDGVSVCGQSVEMVKEFPYLGSTISNNGEVDSDVKFRNAKAANAFGCLRKSISANHRLSVTVERV